MRKGEKRCGEYNKDRLRSNRVKPKIRKETYALKKDGSEYIKQRQNDMGDTRKKGGAHGYISLPLRRSPFLHSIHFYVLATYRGRFCPSLNFILSDPL